MPQPLDNKILIRCRICKADHVHRILKDFDTLPPDVLIVECFGCGALGMHRVAPVDKPVDDTPTLRSRYAHD